MHLIATGGGTTVDTNTNEESVGALPTNDQPLSSPQELIDENLPDDEQLQLPLVTVPSSSSIPMDTDPQTTIDVVQPPPQQQATKSAHNIAEIHHDMMNLIPIPQAWAHIRHQSGLFSYPDLPHFNVIRQATFREGRFVCPFCTVDFASKEGIRYHLYNSCTKSPYPKAFFRCLMCGSELADRSSLRTHLARHVSFVFCFSKRNLTYTYIFQGTDEGGAGTSNKIDVSRKPSGSGDTPNSKKSKKKKKNSNDLTPPQMLNPMLTMTSGVSPRGIDTYNIPPTMINQHISSLPIIKSEPNDSDPKVKSHLRLIFIYRNIFSVNVVVHQKRNVRMDQHQ
jgi:hypothetical protein